MENIDDIGSPFAEIRTLDEVVEREGLSEISRSFFELFGISVRVYSATGGLIAEAHDAQSICSYVNTFPEGAALCQNTVQEAQALVPSKVTLIHPCFTGAEYRVVPIRYQARTVGRFIVGPYLPAATQQVPKRLLKLSPDIDRGACQESLGAMPRVKPETADRMCKHLQGFIDQLIFTSHRSQLASEMHVGTLRAHYREQAQRADELQKAYNQLKELDRLKSNFLATISHELRTPLTSIIGYAEMLGNGLAGELNEEQRDFAQTIEERGEHLLALITSLLDMSRLEQGNLRLSRAPVGPRILLDDIFRTVSIKADKKKILLSVAADDGLSYIDGDPIRLRQIFVNLTDNAIKFTPTGGTVKVLATPGTLPPSEDDSAGGAVLSAPRAAITISVHDSGIGIPEPELERIFHSFYQVDSSSTRQHDGVGLGLSIVQRLVQAHGGRIRVESQVRSGTTFSVDLPIARSEIHP